MPEELTKCKTKEAVERALGKMMEDSRLFASRQQQQQQQSSRSQSHVQLSEQSQLLPRFQASDVEVGKILGRGNFGVVLEVSCLLPLEAADGTDLSLSPFIGRETQKKRNTDNYTSRTIGCQNNNQNHNKSKEQSKSLSHYLNAMIGPHNTMDYHTKGEEDDDDNDDDKTEETISCSGHTNNTTGATSTRGLYALKRIKHKEDGSFSLDGTIDLAREALFLACFDHANIIKCHGTVGSPESQSTYGIVLDRLRMTLKDRMRQWRQRQKPLAPRFPGAPVLSKKRRALRVALLRERLEAISDICSALAYLHDRRVAFRDLKPENVGFDGQGTLKLFDFGMAKEFKEKDTVDDGSRNGKGRRWDGCYKATGLAGSPLYMAPEVIRSMPYGLSVDVYSFGILSWRVLALKRPYRVVDANVSTLFEAVVLLQVRPGRIAGLPKSLNRLMKNCWAEDQRKRPAMAEIRVKLRSELAALNGGFALFNKYC